MSDKKITELDALAAGNGESLMVIVHGGVTYKMTVDDFVTTIGSVAGFADGKSTYELAVEDGFVGTLSEWLLSLIGENGKSAYELAVLDGFVGTYEDWRDSLQGLPGDNGLNGWSPIFGIVTDGTRRVLQLVDWTGGTGTKPAVGKYIGSDGLKDTAAEAVDIRGPQGIAGTPALSSACAGITIDGGDSVITTGTKGDIFIPFACTIQSVTLLADQVGSLVVDIWADSFENFPPTVDDSIVGAAPPTLSASDKSQDSTLTGWTTSLSAGRTLRFNVDSASNIQRATLVLNLLKS